MHGDDALSAGYSPAIFEDPATGPLPYDEPGSLADAHVDLCDTDGDGRADTVAITRPGDGTTLLTDIDGDGRTDVATAIGDDGAVRVSEHTADGQWTVVGHSRVGVAAVADGSTGFASPAGWAGAGSADSGSSTAAVVDPATGEWTEVPLTGG